MAPITPHFDLPFRFYRGKAVVVQQDTEKDVTNCVHAAVRTVRGTRFLAPNFGITDLPFSLVPMNLGLIEEEIRQSEPRASLVLRQRYTDVLTDILQIAIRQVEQ